MVVARVGLLPGTRPADGEVAATRRVPAGHKVAGDPADPPLVPRVAVIGGGLLGVSSAVRLARLGARATLVTEGVPASQRPGTFVRPAAARERSGSSR